MTEPHRARDLLSWSDSRLDTKLFNDPNTCVQRVIIDIYREVKWVDYGPMIAFLRNNKNIETVEIRSIGYEDLHFKLWQRLIPPVSKNSAIQNLELEFYMDGNFMEVMIKVLDSSAPKLRRLRIKQDPDDKLGTINIGAMARFAATIGGCTKLQDLEFQFCNDSMMYFHILNSMAKSSFPSLKKMCIKTVFGGWKDTQDGTAAIHFFLKSKAAPSLRKLSLSGGEFTPSHMTRLVDSLSTTATSIKVLKFRPYELSNEAATILSDYILNSCALEKLELGGRRFGMIRMLLDHPYAPLLEFQG